MQGPAEPPGRLARRTGSTSAASVSEWLILGTAALLGVSMWGWSATLILLWFVIGVWIEILLDLVMMLLVWRSVRAHHEIAVAHQKVWAIVRKVVLGPRPRRRDDEATEPGLVGGMLLDLLFGSFGTAALMIRSELSLRDVALAIQSDDLRLPLLVLAGWALFSRLVRVVQVFMSSESVPVALSGTGRGVALFLLCVPVVLIFGEASVIPRGIVMALNGGVVLLALLSLFGVPFLARQNRWLHDYLASRNSRVAGRA